MAMKEAPKKTYRTMQGKEIELDKLIMRNETVLAVGNAKVNARGDEIDDLNRVITTKNEAVNRQYKKTVQPQQIRPRSTGDDE